MVTKDHSKKHKSLLEKNKKKEDSLHHNHSFLSKSLPKTADQSANSSGNKKASFKKEILKPSASNPQISADYIKTKFYKTLKPEKKTQSDSNFYEAKEIAKPNHFFN